MPACGSEGACLRGLCTNGSSKTGQASPVPPHQHRYPHHKHIHRRSNEPYPRHHHHDDRSYFSRMVSSILGLAHKILTCSILAPAIWFSAWICFFWFLLRLPLVLVRLVFKLGPWGDGPVAPERRQRCVLVSGGSTVQAVQLARSLSRLGEARVVVCDLEGLFGLARFSRACARYYTLPRPSSGAAAEYVRALADIVKRERVTAFVPVSASGTAYYDALAKPHLELLGCECLVPGAAEVALLDDPLELLRRARLLGLPRPWHQQLSSLEEAATRFYDQSGLLREPGHRFYALRAGPAGMRSPETSTELRLPGSLAEFARAVNLLQSVGDPQLNRAGSGWVVLRDPGGPHFLSCCSVRDSRLVGSVTCRLNEDRGGELVVEERPEVRRWLERFFSRGSGPSLLASGAKFSGHLSFRLVGVVNRPGEVAAIGCRVGMGLAYLGLGTSEQVARLLWNSTPSSGPPGPVTPAKVIDKKEALFFYWDPLPYCVYCYLQLPFRRLLGLLGPQQTQHKPPLGVVQ